jgi:hypothetical protein
MDVSLRVAIAVFVILAPTVLFLGLWRGLTSLRDDDLAGEVTARQLRGLFDTLPTGQPNAGRFEEVPDGGIEGATAGRPSRSEPAEDRSRSPTPEIEIGVETDPAECSRCAEPNPTEAELCWGCGAYLNE